MNDITALRPYEPIRPEESIPVSHHAVTVSVAETAAGDEHAVLVVTDHERGIEIEILVNPLQAELLAGSLVWHTDLIRDVEAREDGAR